MSDDSSNSEKKIKNLLAKKNRPDDFDPSDDEDNEGWGPLSDVDESTPESSPERNMKRSEEESSEEESTEESSEEEERSVESSPESKKRKNGKKKKMDAAKRRKVNAKVDDPEDEGYD